ncbi:hypothetical protein TrVE_jg7012 [Triparma verrucosa]|uniref:Phosphoglycerate mutase-like protein n=1 Tax=Triparma verrucosa TaxID=1606542 RepID=A0A9W7CGD2_9STRA|nr:hypothetical protein TrVE_jg7012 [Triparma verrucosa]
MKSLAALPPRMHGRSSLSTLAASSFLEGSKLKHFEALDEAAKQVDRSGLPVTLCRINKNPTSPPDASSVRLLLIRHGEAEHNVFSDNFKGEGESSFHPDCPIDPFLTEKGLSQAKALIPQTSALVPQPSLILTSPLKRATQTALAAFPDGRSFMCSHLLTEGSNGVREDMISDGESLSKFFPSVDYSAYNEDCDIAAEHAITPNSDLVFSKRKLMVRSDDFLRQIQGLKDEHRVIGVATHSQWLQSFCNFSLNFEDASESLEWFGTGELRVVDVEFRHK